MDEAGVSRALVCSAPLHTRDPRGLSPRALLPSARVLLSQGAQLKEARPYFEIFPYKEALPARFR